MSVTDFRKIKEIENAFVTHWKLVSTRVKTYLVISIIFVHHSWSSMNNSRQLTSFENNMSSSVTPTWCNSSRVNWDNTWDTSWPCEAPPGGGVLPYMGYIGMCRCEGYGFQAVYSRIGYINQNNWSRIGYHFSGNWSVAWRFYLD